MSLQFRTSQFADSSITPAKLDTATVGVTYNFGSVGLLYKSNSANITGDAEVATKGYVDGVANGLYWKDAVTAGTTSALNATYNNGSSGVGATLTNAGTNASFDIDNAGSSIGGFSVGDRVLVKDQAGANAPQNGIYEVTTVGDGSTAWVLTRTNDQNDPEEFMSSAVFVSAGDTNAGIGFVCTSNVDTIGTDDVSFTAFSGTAGITAGAGLSKAGSTLNVELSSMGGLTFNTTGDDGTLEVALGTNEGLINFAGYIGVDYDDSTIGIVSNQLAVKTDGIGLTQFGVRYQADEFSGTGATLFTLANAVSVSAFQNGANVKVYLNGQRLRVAPNMSSSMAEGSAFVFQDGSDTKIAIKTGLDASDYLLADYVR